MVATNAAGPRSVRCGSVRNWVEAVEILEVDGSARRVERGVQGTARWHLDHAARELVRARFPRTRKNSAGYALDRFADSAAELDLLVGSEGTLAFVTAVEWRLEPIPVDAAGGALGFPRPGQLGDAGPHPLAPKPSPGGLLDPPLLGFVPGRGPG